MSANPALADDSIDIAFPRVEPGMKPLGSRIMVQIRLPRSKTKGGIILTAESKDIDSDNMQTARVVALGPLAFHNRETMKEWPEGAWVQEGDFVRVPKYGGDRFRVPFEGGEPGEHITFAVFNDLDLTAAFTINPMEHKAYL